MKKLGILFSYLENSWQMYVVALICTLVAQVVVALEPQLVRIVVDSILVGKGFNDDWLSALAHFFIGSRTGTQALLIMASFILAFALCRALLTYLRGILATTASEESVRVLRNRLYNHIQLLPMAFHSHSKTGDLIQRCTSDIKTIRTILSSKLLDVVSSLFLTIYILYLMAQSSLYLTAFSFLAMLLTFSSAFIFYKNLSKLFEKAEKAESKMVTGLQENLTGIRIIKAFQLHNSEIKKFKKRSEDFCERNLKVNLGFSIFWGITDFLTIFHIAGVAILGSVLAYKQIISVGTLMACISYAATLSYPLVGLARTLSELGKSFVSSERIQTILSEPIEDLYPTKKCPPITGNISFNSVSFAYPDSPDNLILDSVSFNIKAGQTIGILGHTGSGKSSLTYLLSRLYEYNSGSIIVDGLELNTIDKGWIRKNIALILQEPFLYSKTIFENIKLASPDVSEEVVKKYSAIASLDDEIEKFEDGYNTKIGERGVSLSGGQKQRLAIARSLIKNSPVVIFDDSLSAVDTETDTKIRQAINKIKGEKTLIIISHRISTIANADKIIVLKDGKLIQEGTHQQLINEEGWYKEIYTRETLNEPLINAN